MNDQGFSQDFGAFNIVPIHLLETPHWKANCNVQILRSWELPCHQEVFTSGKNTTYYIILPNCVAWYLHVASVYLTILYYINPSKSQSFYFGSPLILDVHWPKFPPERPSLEVWWPRTFSKHGQPAPKAHPRRLWMEIAGVWRILGCLFFFGRNLWGSKLYAL